MSWKSYLFPAFFFIFILDVTISYESGLTEICRQINFSKTADNISERTGPWFNIKMPSYRYRKPHCGDKTILGPSYIYNGILYTGKETTLHCMRAQGSSLSSFLCLWSISSTSWLITTHHIIDIRHQRCPTWRVSNTPGGMFVLPAHVRPEVTITSPQND